jgi:hypothetical protein
LSSQNRPRLGGGAIELLARPVDETPVCEKTASAAEHRGLVCALIVPVFFTNVAVTYVSNEEIARANADGLIERFRTDAIDSIQSMFNPIKSLARSAAIVGSQQPDFYSDNRSLKHLFSMLLHSDKLVSVYVGMADGSFRQARRINPTVEIQNKLPPVGVKYAYRWIEPPAGLPPIDHYLFLDEEHNPLGSSEQTTTYDPNAALVSTIRQGRPVDHYRPRYLRSIGADRLYDRRPDLP